MTMQDINISAHISYAEATKSQTAVRYCLDNTPTPEALENMKLVAEKCFEPLRLWYGKPIGISSFYRSEEVNAKVSKSPNSQHTKGMAIDIDADIFNNGITNTEIFEWLKNNVEFDQLISEFGTVEKPAWIHVSFNRFKNRRQILRIG